MTASTKPKPRVFISSTIYDFRDMRSALRHWLSERGYDVQLSEYNDFVKTVETHSYEACLRAISDCEYFILLIGGRVGGFLNETDRISITRAEYRAALTAMNSGKTKIITVVRKELWDIREDRKGLAAALAKESGLDAGRRNNLKNHSSSMIDDAESIFSFINEVCQNEETRKAIKEGGPFPVANWIHPIADFSDLVKVCNSTFAKEYGLKRDAILAQVIDEIEFNLQALLIRTSGSLWAVTWRTMFLRNEISGNYENLSTIKKENVVHFTMGIVEAMQAKAVRSDAISGALGSSEFLSYNAATDTYEVSDVQRHLRMALDKVKSIKSGELQMMPDWLKNIYSDPKTRISSTIDVPNIMLLPYVSHYELIEHAILFFSRLLNYLLGNADAFDGFHVSPKFSLIESSGMTYKDGERPAPIGKDEIRLFASLVK